MAKTGRNSRPDHSRGPRHRSRDRASLCERRSDSLGDGHQRTSASVAVGNLRAKKKRRKIVCQNKMWPEV